MAIPFSWMPSCLNDEKKLGPTCRPIEKMKRIRPNSWMNLSVAWSTSTPRWPTKIPQNSTKVAPSEIPKIFTLPSITPMAMTTA